MTVLFFMWGFMTVFNDILIPRFKEAFTLDDFQAMLVQFAFFGAYFIGSLLYFVISATTGDPIARLGYKNGVVVGLLLSAVGSALFWGGRLIGRFMGAVELSEMKKINKQLFLAGIPILAFLIICFASGWHPANPGDRTLRVLLRPVSPMVLGL